MKKKITTMLGIFFLFLVVHPSPGWTQEITWRSPTQSDTSPTDTSQTDTSQRESPATSLHEEPQPEQPRRRRFGLGITLLNDRGYGVAARVRINHVAFDGVVSFLPWIMLVMGACEAFDLLPALRIGGSILIFFQGHERRFQHGLSLSGFYDSVAKLVTNLNWVGELSWGTHRPFAMSFFAGIAVTPFMGNEYKAWVDKQCPDFEGELSMMTLYHVMISAGITLMFYLF